MTMRTLTFAAIAIAAAGCPSDVVSDGTGVALHVAFDPAAKLDRLRISFALEGKPAFHAFDEPQKPAPLDPKATNVDVLLPSSLAGKSIAIAVDGFAGASLEASGEVVVKLVAGKKVAASVTLGAGESCGDGKLRADLEQCDDGNADAGDGCSSSCEVEPGYACTGEPSLCAKETCGDGVLDDGEACDDGGNVDGDGCSHACSVEPGYTCTGAPSQCTKTCGDGVIDDNEECDDHNTNAGDGCSPSCAVEPGYVCAGAPSVCAHTCGNGALDPNEGCDDNNVIDGDGCTSSCVVEAGYVCAGTPSHCSQTCGNATVDAGEACDDGNAVAGDGCSPTCVVEQGFTCPAGGGACAPVCGDGFVRGLEECDDQNTGAGDGCSSTCTLEIGFQCAGEPSTCSPACNVAGVFVAAGATDPANACRICDPTQNPADYVDNDGATCDDGTFCNGADTCSGGACNVHAGNPCAATSATPSCDEANARCDCAGASCDDGAFCDGSETCDPASGACVAGTPPSCSPPTPVCSPASDSCAECAVDADCGDPQNPSCLGGVCVCSGCGCPFGQHDGGDGVCVNNGTCSPGFDFAFVDADGDGVGAGPLTSNCVPGPPFPPGFSTIAGDCNDGDPSVFQIQHVFPDRDGDGFTAAGEDDCVGATLPGNLHASPSPPPFIAYDCLSAQSITNPDHSWQNADNAERVGLGNANSSASNGTSFSEQLVLSSFDVRVPASATIVGIELHVFRRQNGGNSNDFVADSQVRLTLNANAPGSGTNEAQPVTTHWAKLSGSAFEEAVYGGRTDTWGLALAPSDVNASTFGVVLRAQMQHNGPGTLNADLDAVVIRVFTSDASRVDCNDSDQTVFSTSIARTDVDGDRFTIGPDQTLCTGSTLATTLTQAHNAGDDCFDTNASAHPGQAAFFSVNRGDGSFDYNCDSSTTRSPTSVGQDTACSCDGTALTCFVASSTSHNTTNSVCGSSVSSDFCSNNGGTCDDGTGLPNDAACTLTGSSTTIKCH